MREAKDGDSATSIPRSELTRCQIRRAVCRCLRGTWQSATRIWSMNALAGPITGAACAGDRSSGGIAELNARHTKIGRAHV